MKKVVSLFILILVLVSCGEDNGHFKIEGKLMNLDQGEFYIYSPYGGIDGIDTIKVEGGRFAYEMPCTNENMLMLVFPNFSEQPVFAEPGGSVNIKGDASHLKEMTIKGTKENDLMNKFRQQIVNSSPPETKKFAEQFIKDHPESAVSTYLIRKYFIANNEPDYKKALHLLELIQKNQPKNGMVARMYQQVKKLPNSTIGSSLPAFSAQDINGIYVSSSSLAGSSIGVVTVWASWSFESMNMQRQLKQLQKGSRGKLKLVSICVDATKKDCKETLERDSISWPNICDQQMIDSPVMKTLGLYSVPDNIVIKNGQIVARDLDTDALLNKVRSLL
jgi:hypothetical protein